MTTSNCPICNSIFEQRPYAKNPNKVKKFCTVKCSNKSREKHGHTTHNSQSKTYSTYTNMIGRCTRKGHSKYHKYGLIGIKVCDRWLESFDNFLLDMGPRPDGTTIDRINGSLGYYKENCRWSTIKEQQGNLKNNIYVTYKGERKLAKDWAIELGIPTLPWRLKNGWGVEKAFSTPSKMGNRIIKTKQVLITYKDKTQCLSEWAREYGLSNSLLRLRMSRGWSFELCLVTPKGIFNKKTPL